MASLQANIQNKVNGYSTSWFESLDNMNIISDNYAIGTTNTEINLNEILGSYCRSLPCDFVKSHPSSLKRKREQNHSSSRFLWQMKNIPFDGIPFCVTSHEILKCKFSMNYNTKKKRKREDIEREDKEINESSLSLCPAKITIKKLKRYPTFSLSLKAAKQEKLNKLKKLKKMLDENQNIDDEEIYWLSIPLASYHNHDFQGKDRFINKDILVFVKQMINKGIHSPKKLKVLVDNHVNEMFKNCCNPPLFDDEAYHPTEENLRFIVYNFKNRKKISEVQQFRLPERNFDCNKNSQNIKENNNETSSWKPNSLQDVVDAYCRSPLKDEHISTYAVQPTQPTVLDLREKISSEIERIIKVVNATDNINKLEYILSGLQSLENYEDSYVGVLEANDNYVPENIQEYSISPYTFTNF